MGKENPKNFGLRCFQLTYGDGTINAAVVHSASLEVAMNPGLGAALSRLEVVLSVTGCNQPVKGTLELPLPDGATVCDYEFQIEQKMVKAVCTGKKKAASIAYKEQEKGREVSSVATVQANVWRADVFPLPPDERRTLAATFLSDVTRLTPTCWELKLPFGFGSGVDWKVTHSFPGFRRQDFRVVDESSSDGVALSVQAWAPVPPQVFTTSGEDGHRHFAVFVPYADAISSLKTTATTGPVLKPSESESVRHLVVVWDTSSSRRSLKHASEVELLRRIASTARDNHIQLSMSLALLDTRLRPVQRRQSVAEIIATVETCAYDGGTDLSLLDTISDHFGPDVDGVVLFSDGISNIQRYPKLHNAPFPVHCVSGPAPRDLSFLRWLAHTGGGTCLPSEDPCAPALLVGACAHNDSLMLTTIEPRQDGQRADVAVYLDETCVTVPDFRLKRPGVHIPQGAGVLLTGTLPQSASISGWAVGLSMGQKIGEFMFPIPSEGSTDARYDRLLQVLHCRAVMDEGFVSFYDPEGARRYLRDCAIQYGIVSDHTTLLLLHDAPQFVENGVPCPTDHPAHEAWKELEEKGRREDEDSQQAHIERRTAELDRYIKLYDTLADFQRPKKVRLAVPLGGLFGWFSRGLSLAAAMTSNEAWVYECCASGRRLAHGAQRVVWRDYLCPPAHIGELVAQESGVDAELTRGERCGDAPDQLLANVRSPATPFQESGEGGGPGAGNDLLVSDAVTVSKPLARGEYLDKLAAILSKKTRGKGRFDEAYRCYLGLRDDHKDRPSFYVHVADFLRDKGADPGLCVNIISNVLEMRLRDAQTCRVVAYHMISQERLDDAICLLEMVSGLAPEEPQSYLDIAWCRFMRLRRASRVGSEADAEVRAVVKDLVKVLKGQWSQRFEQIEWPALLLLSWVVDWAEHELQAGVVSNPPYWPEDDIPLRHRIAGIKLALMAWMGWDTDHTDIDLHVQEPDRREVYYQRRRSDFTGAHLSRDFTGGYGPEVYILRSATAGKYIVSAKYYGGHQASMTTGATSVVLWTVTNLGDWGREDVRFKSVRLTSDKQKETVFTLKLKG